MYKRMGLTVALGLIVATLLSACAPAAPGPKPLTKVSIGYTAGEALDYLPLVVARERGFFQEEGIELDAVISEGGAKVKDIFIAGDTQIAIFGLDLASQLLLSGVDIRVIGIMTEAMGWGLVARKDLGAKSVKDLKGKSVGVSAPGSLSHGVVVYAAKQVGLDPEKDIAIVGVGGAGARIAALKAKKVDAATLFEPSLSQALEEGTADEVYSFLKEVRGLSTTHFVVKKAYIDKNPEVVKAWLRAIEKGLKYIRSNKEDAFQVARKQFPETPESVLRRAFESYLPVFPEKTDYPKKLFEFERDVFLKIGFVKEMVNYEQMEYKR